MEMFPTIPHWRKCDYVVNFESETLLKLKPRLIIYTFLLKNDQIQSVHILLKKGFFSTFATEQKKEIKKKNKEKTNDTRTYLKLSDATKDIIKLSCTVANSDADEESDISRPTESESHAQFPFAFGDSRLKPQLTIPLMTNGSREITAIRQSLPIYEYRDKILATIQQNQVVIISAETGSTQII